MKAESAEDSYTPEQGWLLITGGQPCPFYRKETRDMKKGILWLLLLTSSTAHASWFGNNEEELKQRLTKTEQDLTAERRETDKWQIASGVLAVGAVVLFTAGTALGSRSKRDADRSNS